MLDYFETQEAIKQVKDIFSKTLSDKLKLHRVSAPKFLKAGTGLQDDLAGTQVPVSFRVKHEEKPIEIVHSLAKWKRHILGKYSFPVGTGLYTDMDAVRKDEDISEIHSVYVDQWDWERVIQQDQRTLGYLKQTVELIYSAMKETEKCINAMHPLLYPRLPKTITFMHSEQLQKKYPDLSPKERERKAAKDHGAIFIIGIGQALTDGKPHDLRAADYDDWSTLTSPETRGLNGDIIIWDELREDALELSSMGIRVDAEALRIQAELTDQRYILKQPYQKSILQGTLPYSIGGGIGQSRLCMALLQKAHIGEVQSSVWPDLVEREFEVRGIPLL